MLQETMAEMPPPHLMVTEVVLLKRPFNSRDQLNRLFQAYVNDFGNDSGKEIIRTIIDVLGGCRLTVPTQLRNSENCKEMRALYDCLCERFGNASGAAIMRMFLLELKGCRISFPDQEDLYREERNRKIKSEFNGDNYQELALRWGLDVAFVWKIINEKYYR
jgi:Mor family transcriptional regulator